ncbi:MAG: hypothetical protein ACRDNS_04445, partial [Trebonia sp.]
VGLMTELPWKPVVYLPTNLTVRLDAEVFQLEDLTLWCEGKAVDLLGSGVKRRQVHRLAGTLMRYIEGVKAIKGRGLPTVAALFFWPDFSTQRASAEVYLVSADHIGGPITPDRARELIGLNEDSLGEIEASATVVPVGQALRAHQFRKLWGALAPHNVMEEVSWFLWPESSSTAVIMTVSWLEPAFSQAGIQIADDMARNFRVEPLDRAR